MYKFGILLITSYICSTTALPPCICARDFHPVCGSNGQTYPNECMLTCASQTHPDLSLARHGACDEPMESCICNFEYKPVCGIDGTTYPNQCALGCERSRNPILEKQYDGPCVDNDLRAADPKLPTCTCGRNMEPVCGTDGVTYSNNCLLKCAAESKPLAKKADGPCDGLTVKVVEQSEEIKSCTCTRNYMPVCGSDGATYGNSCLLGCRSNTERGLRMVHPGPC